MRDRVRDYAVLLAVSAALTLPNLGQTSLWDMDEGVNAQAAREMRDADTWIVPTFNYQLRTAKPALLYWLQRASFAAFGVSEWSARLPSALAAWLAVLLTYELARRMFTRAAALLSGVVLVSVMQFGMLSRGATPDATLLFFTMLTYLAFWAGHASGSRRWWIPTAAACGLAMLTKGPIGVGLPGLVILLYFAWNRELGRLLDRRIAWAALVFLLVAGPWYALVSNETRGEWLTAFFGHENMNRFVNPMDGHRGTVWYYAIAVLVMFAPWSAFIGLTLWYGVRGTGGRVVAGACDPGPSVAGVCDPGADRDREAPASQRPATTTGLAEVGCITAEVRAHRFLVCWVVAYLVFFSAAATKLPNYIFPIYPALAILTARFLMLWRDGATAFPRWTMPAGVAAMALIGVIFAGTLVYADRQFPGLAPWAALGAIPLAGAVAMGWYLRRGDRQGVVNAAAVASVAFVGLVVALPPEVVDRQKAPRELVRASGMADPDRDVRVAAYAWFQHSVVFYTGREVAELKTAESAIEFLAVPTPAYLFVPAVRWDEMAAGVTVPHRVVARRYDFMRKCEVLVITNEDDKRTARLGVGAHP
jgi:4-amino-4-deoxy-L-arabinose transferase-like glycosyltransferase